MTPILSIVIANYNYGRFLEEAIQSVLSQIGEGKDQVHPGEVELIIIDGGSTDNSVDVIKKYANGLPPSHLSANLCSQCSPISYWISEPDRGQSDAFNKGFAKARGRFLAWLNADDLLVPGCLKKILRQMECHPECEWFTGNHYRFVEGTRKIFAVGWGPHFYPKFLQRPNSPLVIFGPTTFFSKRIFDLEGGMDERLHYTMDTDLWIRFMHRGIFSRRLNFFCWAFRMHARSKTAEFCEHKVSDAAAAQGVEETRIRRSKVDYRPSRVIRMLMLAWRILDGSFAMSLYLRMMARMGRMRALR